VPSKREKVIEAVFALVDAATPGTKLARNPDQPEGVPVGGLIIVRDGDPGDPDVDLCPLTYHYQHSIDLEIATYEDGFLTREQALDALTAPIGTAVIADRFLGGLCDWLEATAPVTDDVALDRSALLSIIAHYSTTDPLN